MKRNKEKQRIRVANYRQAHPWISSLVELRQRCNNPKKNWYHLYGGKGIKALITSKEIKELWFKDKAYEMERPSIDRIDSNKDYTFDNCRYLELSINSGKEGYKHRKSILQYDDENKIVKEYDSVKAASKETGIGYSNIRSCAQGQQQTAGGFGWKYKEIA
jgi:hypothetical protein